MLWNILYTCNNQNYGEGGGGALEISRVFCFIRILSNVDLFTTITDIISMEDLNNSIDLPLNYF